MQPKRDKGEIAKFIDDHGGANFILCLYCHLQSVGKIRDLFENVYNFKCSLTPLHKYIKKHDIKINPAGAVKNRKGQGAVQKFFAKYSVADLQKMYDEHGIGNLSQLFYDHNEWDISDNSVLRVIKVMGVIVRGQGGGNKVKGC